MYCRRYSRPYRSTPTSRVFSLHPALRCGSVGGFAAGYSGRNIDRYGWLHRTGTVLWLCRQDTHSVPPPDISSQSFLPSGAGASAYPLPQHLLRSCPALRSSGLHPFFRACPSGCRAPPAMSSTEIRNSGFQVPSARRLSCSWHRRASGRR